MSDASDEAVLPPEKDVYDLMSCSRRRQAVWCLAVADGWELTLRQLAAHVAALHEDAVAVEMRRDDVTSMRTSLNRYHISPLEEAGIIVVDGDLIRPGPHFFAVLPIIQHAEQLDHDRQAHTN